MVGSMEAIMDGEIQTSRRPKSTPWNNGRITGQKRPLKPKDVWAIRIRLQLKCALNRHPLTRNRKFVDSPLEGDGFELPVREHRAMAPSHGFAAASHREAALRGAPASHDETAFRGAAGFREARRHEVHPARARWRSTRGQPRHRFCRQKWASPISLRPARR